MPHVFYIVFGAAFTLAACAGLGRAWLKYWRFELEPAETWIFSTLLGAALWSLLMFLLGATGTVYRGSILIFGVAAMAVGRRAGVPRVWRPSPWLLLALPFVLLYLSNALAPEHSPDGSSYHLGLVSRYYREHGFFYSRYENMYAHLSQGLEMLFLSAWSFGRNPAAALVHFGFQLLLPLMMIAYGRRFGMVAAALAAAALVYFSPVVGIDGTSAYNDVAGAAIVFGVFYLVEVWNESGQARLLPSIGLLAGFAFAIKYTLGLAIPYALVRVAWRSPQARPVLITLACTLVSAGPWLVKNSVVVGNPVAPLFNAWFPNPYVSPAFEASYREFLRHDGGITRLADIPAQVLWHGEKLQGFIGPVWLMAPFALVALRQARGRVLLAAAACFGATYFANIGTRFLIPVLPFAALALCQVLSRWPPLLVIVVLVHGIASWPTVAKRYNDTYAWRLNKMNWRPALGLESQDEFLGRELLTYSAARMIETKVPRGEAVLSFNPEAEAYTSREIRVSYQSTGNSLLADLLHLPLMEEAKPRRKVWSAFAPVRVTGVRVTQQGSDAVEQWRVNEFRLIRNGADVPRLPSWRLKASGNVWTVGEAFDNDPVTRWSAGVRLAPGQILEVELPPAEIDRVVLECPETEHNSHYTLDLLIDGQWRKGAQPLEIGRAPAPLGLRKRATQAIARHGVRWLLIGQQDFGAADYFERRAEWGLELAGEASGRRLYRILD
jgi:hypothetical protein